MTEQRLVILNELSKVSEPESAYLLKDKLDEQGYAFNISTIYRVLEFWMEHNVVHKLTSNNTLCFAQIIMPIMCIYYSDVPIVVTLKSNVLPHWVLSFPKLEDSPQIKRKSSSWWVSVLAVND